MLSLKKNGVLFLLIVSFIDAYTINYKSQFGFIENKGQIINQNNIPNTAVKYLFTSNGLNVQLLSNGFSYDTYMQESLSNSSQEGIDSIYFHRIDIEFINANTNPQIIAQQPSSEYKNFYTTGTSQSGALNVRTYQKVIYINLYNGIDLEFIIPLNFYKEEEQLKYNFIIHPGADATQIRWRYKGALSTAIQNDKIILQLEQGNIEEQIPKSFIEETQQNINVNYVSFNLNEYSFSIPRYNKTATLIIDPIPWATYFGGSGDEGGYAIALDISGNELVTGKTTSSIYVATSGAFQTSYAGTSDIFVAKFTSMGALLWATYYGGTGPDEGHGIAADRNNNVVVTGRTYSNSGIATTGAYQTTLTASEDVFVVKFDSTGVRKWGTYYGGSYQDWGYGIATDASGNILITGNTYSASGIATSGAYDTINSFGVATFIAKFAPSGSILWATYYNGSQGNAITTDKLNNVIVTGYAYATTGIASTGAFQTVYGGGNGDAFVVKFDSTGTTRLWGTYYGIDGKDWGYGITTDTNCNIVATGSTASGTGMASSGAYQTIYGGGTSSGTGDAFIIKFTPNGVRLWSTYYGGSGNEAGNAIATDASGSSICITGNTNTASTLSIMASAGAYQNTYGGGTTDAFVANFSSTGARTWGTYYGGSGIDWGYGIALDMSSNIFITGITGSSSGISHSGAYQYTIGSTGGDDAFITAFSNTGVLPVHLIAFDAKLQNKNNVLCTWQTASELNNDRFELQRSLQPTANSQWLTVGRVKGNGTTNSISSYQFIDTFTLLNITGVFYYRLKQIDFDGEYIYSEIKAVNLSNTKADIEIYPNPSSNKLMIQSNQIQEISIIDILGNASSINFQIINNNQTQIDVSVFKSGIYFLRMITSNGIVNKKIVIE